MADSLKLALVSAIVCALAWLGWLGRLGVEAARTAAFLLYYTWPLLALVWSPLVAFFAVRDIRVGKKAQAAAAIALSLAVLAVSWTQFHGWE